METSNLLAVPMFCEVYNIELGFVNALHEHGLIELVTFEEIQYVQHDHLRDLERLIRLHYDLEINMEGIDVIAHLLKRVEAMQEEMLVLRNRRSAE